MSLALIRRSELSLEQMAGLEKAMSVFYQNPPDCYYQIADQNAGRYNPADHPFHCDLISRVFPGASVLEAGCGTAHLCPYVEERGGRYTGLDHSEALLARNREKFPNARFFKVGSAPETQFDLVASLYTIEHVTDPPGYLEQLWNYCRPGGLIAIICPEFIHSPGFAPSLFFGRTPRRLSQKLKSFDLSDAVAHLLDLKFKGPLWKKRAQAGPAGAFWINLSPRVLHGGCYEIDTDAVHLVQHRDLARFYQDRGAEIIQTSEDLPGVSPEVSRFNCYLLVRKN